MTDLEDEGLRLSSFVTPFRRRLEHYFVEEKLWISKGAPVLKIECAAQVNAMPTYPGGNDRLWSCYSEDTDRAVAMASVRHQIEKRSHKWREDLRIDENFKLSIGRKVRVVHATTYRSGEGTENPSYRQLTPGTLGVVAAHGPGYLSIHFADHETVAITTETFTHTIAKYIEGIDCVDSEDVMVLKRCKREVRVPNPSIMFEDGFAPWV